MRIFENIDIGIKGLLAHKLRAFLTMLGIIFGVGAVVAMLSIGEGARREALKQIELMGMNNIIIQDAELEDEELVEVRAGFSLGLTVEDASAIENIIPQVASAVPLRNDETEIQFGSLTMKVNLISSTPDYPASHNLLIKRGCFPGWDDLASNRRVCVIGNGVKRELFPFTDPVGEDLKIEDQWFTIIGVMASKDVSVKKIGGYQVRNFNDDVLIPLSCSESYFQRQLLQSPLDQIIVKVAAPTDIRAVGNVLSRIISRRHHGQNDFKVIIPEELLRQSQATQRIFNIVMGAIAGISLLVGGIGIMNIMLSSVLERTREIGIRRAVGARRTEIMGQFLIEAVVLSFSGGIIGVILGVALAQVITFYAGWVTIVSYISVITAFGVASAVGLIFGLYPARRAANLHPIEALRYE
ncbi:MAG: ABC transporter permease [candidate division Zixibacteria bacterium]|nr:ABC transporter permease [Candidatus Tariuqbacter arcticus]